jgi:TRAP-type mannitol/chloroaromatic compound transport system permease small subunit
VQHVPSAEDASAVPVYGPGGRVLLAVSKYVAIAGGLVFVAMVVMEIVSIVGRKLFSWTVPGDVELLQMGAAFASATFFAYCHLIRGDVKVDFFTHNAGRRKVAVMDAIGSLLVGLFGALIAWRTGVGAWSLKDVGETSAILGWPVWVAQALMVPSFVLLAVAGFYLFARQMGIARGASR